MKVFRIFFVLTVIGLCSAVPRYDEQPSKVGSGSEGNEVAELTTVIPSSEYNEVQKHESTAVESRGKKKKGAMEHMHMMFSMCKSVLSMIMMLIQPIFQMKALGISLVGMFINIARFVMQLKQSKTSGGGGGGGGTGIGGGFGAGPWMSSGAVWGGEDRIGSSIPATFHPNYITRYSIKQ